MTLQGTAEYKNVLENKKYETAITNASVEALVHIISQASVPQGLSSHIAEASEKQKRGNGLQ